ncbi:MAG: uracil-DNA glycosylase [Spirochaetales bacterium]|nr:uracil-DNA glycosylase [Spirochaetales bacterium]
MSKEKYWKLLDDFEDLLTYQHRVPHEGLPKKVLDGTITAEIHEAPIDQNRKDRLAILEEQISQCTACGLHSGRTNPVPGYGVLNPKVMVIGEGPGAEEDKSGLPFVGRAGKYLDKWLSAINLERSKDCFIGNIIKCRPPGNRDPLPEESSICLPYLEQQVDLIRPKVILTLGRIAAQILTGHVEGIGRLRGKTYSYRGVPLIPTYHPSGVLRNPQYRGAVWEDLKRLQKALDEA